MEYDLALQLRSTTISDDAVEPEGAGSAASQAAAEAAGAWAEAADAWSEAADAWAETSTAWFETASHCGPARSEADAVAYVLRLLQDAGLQDSIGAVVDDPTDDSFKGCCVANPWLQFDGDIDLKLLRRIVASQADNNEHVQCLLLTPATDNVTAGGVVISQAQWQCYYATVAFSHSPLC